MEPAPFDGNATAGDLADVFAVDTTTAEATCATCGARSPLAALGAYLSSHGLVLRCRTCESTQLRFVRSADRAWLDLSGTSSLEMQLPQPPIADVAGRKLATAD